MANPNFKSEWPLYSDADGVFVRALPVKAIENQMDGSAIVLFDGAYNGINLSAGFMAIFRPVTGGYLFRSQYGELLYLGKSDFESKYKASGGSSVSWGDITGKPSTFTPPVATNGAIGGVKQGAAVADSAATDVAGAVTSINALLRSLRDAGIIDK